MYYATILFVRPAWIPLPAPTAYALWSEGAKLLPSDARLERQARKAQTWGGWQACGDSDAKDCATRLMGLAAAAPPFLLESEWTRTTLSTARALSEPALRLFDPSSQRGCIAVQTRSPLLLPDECAEVCRVVEAHVAEVLGGTWGTVRRSTVPTTDIAGKGCCGKRCGELGMLHRP